MIFNFSEEDAISAILQRLKFEEKNRSNRRWWLSWLERQSHGVSIPILKGRGFESSCFSRSFLSAKNALGRELAHAQMIFTIVRTCVVTRLLEKLRSRRPRRAGART